MVRQGKYTSTANLDICYSKIHGTQDVDDLVRLFVPHSLAIAKREGWYRIFKAIRDAPDQKLKALDHLADEYLTQSTLWKARKEMRAVGLITYHMGYWRFSSRFFSNLQSLMRKVKGMMEPVSTERKVKDEVVMRARRSKRAWEEMMKDERTDWSQR